MEEVLAPTQAGRGGAEAMAGETPKGERAGTPHPTLIIMLLLLLAPLLLLLMKLLIIITAT